MKRILTILFTLAIFVGLFTALQLISSSTVAKADPPIIDVGTTIPPGGYGTPPASSGGGGTLPGSGNGGGSPPPVNYRIQTSSWNCHKGTQIPEELGGCVATQTYGGVPITATCYNRADGSISWTISYRWIVYTDGVVLPSSYSCNYTVPRNPNTILDTRQCYTAYDARLYTSKNKDAIRTGGSYATGNPAPNPRNNIYYGPADYYNCISSFSANPSFTLNTLENNGAGYFRIDLTNIKYQYCQLIGYQSFFNDTSRNRVQCGGVGYAGTFSNYAVNACNYAYTRFSSWSALPAGVDFSVGACAAFQCNILNPTTVNGITGPIEVMRNGENVNLQLSRISITGNGNIRNVTNIQAKNDVMKTSKPMNGNDDNKDILNSPDQYFKLKTAGTGKVEKWNVWENQDNNNKWLNFYWAGDASNSFRTERTYKYSAQFLVPVATNTTGGVAMMWQNDTRILPTSGPCTTQSDSIFVVRSVNN